MAELHVYVCMILAQVYVCGRLPRLCVSVEPIEVEPSFVQTHPVLVVPHTSGPGLT